MVPRSSTPRQTQCLKELAGRKRPLRTLTSSDKRPDLTSEVRPVAQMGASHTDTRAHALASKSCFKRRESCLLAVRVGFNGFGRIGRNIFRVIYGRDDIEVRAIADTAAPEQL